MIRKLYNIVEGAFYQRLTHGLAFRKFCRTHNIEQKEYSLDDFKNRNLEPDRSSDIAFVFDAAFSKIHHFPVSEMRLFYPNAQIICFGSDTIFYRKHHNCDEIRNVEQCDLYFDTMEEVVDNYNSRGIKSDIWIWSAAEDYLDRITVSLGSQVKNIDLFSLISLQDKPERIELLTNLRKHITAIFSGGMIAGGLGGFNCSNLDAEISHYYSSATTILGTTSPSWTTGIRTMKGYRDFIAPFMGSPLIYDDHPQIAKYYFPADIVPQYRYGNVMDIVELVNEIKSLSSEKYIELIKKQRKHFKTLTLEKQYERLFRKYGLLN